MTSFSSTPCAFFVDVEWRHEKELYRETLRLPELEIVLSARYRHEPAIGGSLSSSPSSSSASSSSPPPPPPLPSASGRIVWSELGSALLAVTAITTGTRYTIGRAAMREWMAPHATPDAFPDGVLASPVGTEIVAAISLLVANDEADDAGSGGRLAFSCRGRIHTAVAYCAATSGRGAYVGLHDAFCTRRAAIVAADADRVSLSAPSASRQPERAARSVDRVTDAADHDATNSTRSPTASSSPPPPPAPPPPMSTAATDEAPRDTEAGDIRRRVELLKVYRDLRRRGFDSPPLADHATRMSMTTDELAFAVAMLERSEKRSETVAANTEFCKLVAALVVADAAGRVPVD